MTRMDSPGCEDAGRASFCKNRQMFDSFVRRLALVAAPLVERLSTVRAVEWTRQLSEPLAATGTSGASSSVVVIRRPLAQTSSGNRGGRDSAAE